MRGPAWQIAIAAATLGCGPTVADATSADASTTSEVSTTTTSADDVLTGSEDVTTAVADTSSGGSTGEPIIPGCETPGSCDDACVQWEEFVESDYGSWIEAVAIAPDGTILAIEAREGGLGGSRDAVLRGFDMAGEPLFEASLFAEDPDAPMNVGALAVSTDGVIAIVKNEVLGEQAYWASLDVRTPEGTPLWDAALGTEVSTTLESVAFGGDGSIVVGGTRNDGLFSGPGFLVAYEPLGEMRWAREGDDLALDVGGVTAIARSSATDFVLAGWADDRLWLGRVDLDGNVAWTVTDDAAVTHSAIDIAVTSDGDVLVVGYEADGGGYPVQWFGRFTAEGSLISSVAYPPIDGGTHELDGIEVTDDGRIFLAGGRVNESGGTSRHVLEIACDGTAAWEWTHTNPKAYDFATFGGLAWSPIIGLVVGGGDYGGNESFAQRGFATRLVP